MNVSQLENESYFIKRLIFKREVKFESKILYLPLSSCDLQEQICISFDIGKQLGIILLKINSKSVDLSQSVLKLE